MNYNIPNRVLKDLCCFAKENNISKIILFGSRARGTNTERSDIDIAVSGGNFEKAQRTAQHFMRRKRARRTSPEKGVRELKKVQIRSVHPVPRPV